jgi:RNA polymerase sigma factor (sigma-70 family)
MNDHAHAPDLSALLRETGWLRALAQRMVADPDRASDLAQHAIAVAIERPPREEGGLRAWLRVVMRNLLRQELRGERRRAMRERIAARTEALPSTFEIVECIGVQRAVAGAVIELREPFRTAILLRFYQGLADREIAARLGVPVSTVSNRIARGVGLLRRRLQDQYPEDELRRMLGLVALPLGGGAGATTKSALDAAAPTAGGLARAVAVPAAIAAILASGRDGSTPDPGVAPKDALVFAKAIRGGSPAANPPPAILATRAAAEASPSDAVSPAPSGAANAAAGDELPAQDRAALVLLEEARLLSRRVRELVWPGFDLEAIPIALYAPGRCAYLAHHSSPPPDYRELEASPLSCPVLLGPVAPAMNANTSGAFAGKVCAFAALDNVAAGGRADASGVALLLHECAHAFQERAPDGGKARWPSENSALVATYPVESAENNAWARIEGALLRAALEAADEAALASGVRDFLAVRRHRQGRFAPEYAEYEAHLELNEGLADYFALRALLAAGDGYAPHPAAAELGLASSEFGPGGSHYAQFLVNLAQMNVGGRGAERRRFYLTGAAQGLLLDRLDPGWKHELERSGTPLQDLLARALAASGGVDAGKAPDALEIGARQRVDELLREETEAAAALVAARRARIAKALEVGGRVLVLDLSRAGGAGRVLSFDPMNLIAVDGSLRLHTRMLNLGFDGGRAAFTRPVVQGISRGAAVCALAGDARVECGGETWTAADDDPGPLDLHGATRVRANGVELDASAACVLVEEDLVLVAAGAAADETPDAQPWREWIESLRAYERQPLPIPRFRLADLEGRTIEQPDPRRRPAVLVIFSAAGWATPSNRLARELLEGTARAEAAAAGGRLLLVASQCTPAELERFLGATADRSDVLHDPDRALAQRLGVETYPTAVYLDPDGRIESTVTGYAPRRAEEIVARLRRER